MCRSTVNLFSCLRQYWEPLKPAAMRDWNEAKLTAVSGAPYCSVSVLLKDIPHCRRKPHVLKWKYIKGQVFPLCQLPTWSMLTKWETLHCLLGIGEVERGDRGRKGGKRGKSITLFSLMYMSIQPPCFVVQMWMSVVKTTPCVRRGPTASTHQETISATVSYAFCHVMVMCLLACDGHVTGM